MTTLLLAQGIPSYPVPPADLSAPHTLSMAFTIICSIFWLLALGWVVRLASRGDSLGVFFLFGGLIMGVLEPGLDYLGLLWFAPDNVAIAVNLFGRHIPLYVVLGYSFFFGLQAYVVYRAILLGKGKKFFLYAVAISWLFDMALQVTGAQFGLYNYYGHQPYLFFGAPAWWYSIDATFQLAAGLLLFLIRHRLVGWGRLLIIPILPSVYSGLNGAFGWPVFASLNSNYHADINGNPSTPLVYLGGTLTIGLCALAVWLLVGEIHRAQVAAGIEVNHHVTAREVLLAKVGIGLSDPIAEVRGPQIGSAVH